MDTDSTLEMLTDLDKRKRPYLITPGSRVRVKARKMPEAQIGTVIKVIMVTLSSPYVYVLFDSDRRKVPREIYIRGPFTRNEIRIKELVT